MYVAIHIGMRVVVRIHVGVARITIARPSEWESSKGTFRRTSVLADGGGWLCGGVVWWETRQRNL